MTICTPDDVVARARALPPAGTVDWVTFLALAIHDPRRRELGEVHCRAVEAGTEPEVPAVLREELVAAIDRVRAPGTAWLAEVLSREVPGDAALAGIFGEPTVEPYRRRVAEAIACSLAWLENFRTAMTSGADAAFRQAMRALNERLAASQMAAAEMEGRIDPSLFDEGDA
jgi:hypothetical protein